MIELNTETSLLVIVDMQEKLIQAAHSPGECIIKQRLMLQAAILLGLDVIVTEQSPQKLGRTTQAVKDILIPEWPVIEKTSFSCFGEPEFKAAVSSKTRKSIIVTGLEAHVCIQQTVLDALAAGYQVFVLADGITSRYARDCDAAINLMRQAGAVISTAESILFMLMKSSEHPQFRKVSQLVK
ncbi:MAG: isochorismatase family protein [Victivallaceae bacterium]